MKYIISLIALLTILSCNNTWDSNLLIGNWEVTNWERIDDQQKLNGIMNFEFKKDGRYNLDYGVKKEEGKYWIFGTFLHTVEDGQSEKKVKIVNLSSNKLSFHMNRSGILELVTLSKK